MLIPSHFRFKNKKEAEHWGVTTKDWNTIQEICPKEYGASISTVDFAWVEWDKKEDNLEFSCRAYSYCKKCKEELVNKKGNVCEYCEQENE